METGNLSHKFHSRKGVMNMNIICDKKDLLDGISIVLKAIPGKTTMKILECMVIEVEAGSIKLISNDLEMGIETIIPGQIIEEGSIAVNAKIFYEGIRKLDSSVNEVKIQSVDDNTNLKVSSGKTNYDIKEVKGTEEFPLLPTIVKEKFVTISQFTLKNIIRQTVFSISDNENTKIMTGELFEIKGDRLRVVSLDGHRISIRKVQLKESYDDISVVIPGKTLNEISKILNDDLEDEVHIYFTEKHVLFEFDHTILLSRLIEGEYYKIEKMLSSDYDTKVIVNKKDMLDTIDRTTFLIKESEKKPVIIDIKDDVMKFSINSARGSMDEPVNIQKEGKDIMIGFNPKFLMEALRVIDDEEVKIYLINPKAPCFIRDDEETYIYLILPVNFMV